MRSFSLFISVCILCGAYVIPVLSFADTAPAEEVIPFSQVRLAAGKSLLLPARKFLGVESLHPKIVGVERSPLTNRVSLVGKSPGTAQVLLQPRGGQPPREIIVHVDRAERKSRKRPQACKKLPHCQRNTQLVPGWD